MDTELITENDLTQRGFVPESENSWYNSELGIRLIKNGSGYLPKSDKSLIEVNTNPSSGSDEFHWGKDCIQVDTISDLDALIGYVKSQQI